MPRAKRKSRAGARPRPPIPPLAGWFLREILPLVSRRPPSRSARHLRNAGIEVLEALRACLDEAIEWLRSQESSERLKRIEVED